jgi:SAM-dependent methyltransferase
MTQKWSPVKAVRKLASLPETEHLDKLWMSRIAESLPAGSYVLDAGAGQCQYRAMFAQQRYVAVDLCVGDATWDFSSIHVRGALDRLPMQGSTFDHVILMNVLEHVPNPADVLKELSRVLRPGGELYVAVPFSGREHQIPYDFYRYTRYGLAFLLEQAGFNADYIEPVGADIYRLWCVLSEQGHHFKRSQLGRLYQFPIWLLKLYISVFRNRLESFEVDSAGTGAWHVKATKR